MSCYKGMSHHRDSPNRLNWYIADFSVNFRESIRVSCHILTLTPIWILGPLHVHLQKSLGQKNILKEYVGKNVLSVLLTTLKILHICSVTINSINLCSIYFHL